MIQYFKNINHQTVAIDKAGKRLLGEYYPALKAGRVF